MGKFTKDVLITFISRGLQLIIGLLVSVIIARTLGPERNGIYSLAILLPALLVNLMSFGLNSALVFNIGQKKYSTKEILGANIIYSALISIFAITIGLIFIPFFSDALFPGIAKEYLFLVLSLIPLIAFFSIIENILLGLQKIKKYNFIELIRTFTFLFFIIILLLWFHFGIKAAIFAEALSFFVGCVVLFLYVKGEIGDPLFLVDKNLFKDTLSYGHKVYLGNIATFLHSKIVVWMINVFLNPLAVGFYSVAAILSDKIQFISQSAGTVLFPKVSSETEKIKVKEFTPLVCRNILFITLLIVLILFLFSRWIIVLFYSKRYLESILPFQILLIGTIARSGYIVITYDLAGRGKPMVNTYVAIGALVSNVLLNIILIPKFGIIGAAWSVVISYVIAFLLELFMYSRISGNKIKDMLFLKKLDFQFYKDFNLLEKLK